MHEFNWSPGIGDPTVGGWITVLLYAAACVSCWSTASLLRLRSRDTERERLAWRWVAVLFLLLGINKQLDLQTGFTELGRVIASSGGWYESRQTVQIYFIGLVAFACMAVAGALLFLVRKASFQAWIGLSGAVFVLGYVLIRAASFHHIDRFIGGRVLGFKWNWILEMGGISVVILGSEWRRRSHASLVPRLSARRL